MNCRLLKRGLLSSWIVLLLTACSLPTARQPKAAEVAPAAASPAEQSAETVSGVDLDAIKRYALEQGAQMQVATQALAATAQDYYDLVQESSASASGADPYVYLWAEHPDEAAVLVSQAKEQWLAASTYYELNEGIVAGVPSLSYYDVWIDAGPPAAEAPDEALEWQLELPNGTVLESPGNFFHNLLEPAIWGTHTDYSGLPVDLNQDGDITLGETLPEANLLLAAAQGLDAATAEMNRAIERWEPSMQDAFTALVTMIPTMNEYFEQWKESAYVAGQEDCAPDCLRDGPAESFVAVSRLFDIHGILNGLSVTYDNIAPQIEAQDAVLHAQIRSDFDRLIAYVDELYAQEQAGVHFAAEEADLFGTEAQDLASALAALVAHAATLLEIELDLV